MTDPTDPTDAVASGENASAAGEPAGSDVADGKAQRAVRRYKAAVSAGAMGLAWANQEQAPSGSVVVVIHEVSPLGRLGQVWTVPATDTLAFAVVLRPTLSAEEADIPWIVAGLGVAEGLEETRGAKVAVVWPDSVVDAGTNETLAAIRADVQLGPGKVKSAVITVRVDVTALSEEQREALLAAICEHVDRRNDELAEGVAGPLATYERRCATIGHNLKIRLIPRGELRAHAAAIDSLGRLECRSPTGMVEKVSVNQIRAVEVL